MLAREVHGSIVVAMRILVVEDEPKTAAFLRQGFAERGFAVDVAALRALKRDLLKRVGELAAGWNAGAQKLGVKLPAWVACHGSKRSAVAVINTFTRFRIILTNAVKYVTNVESYDCRIQSAINIQGRKMQHRAEFLLKRVLQSTGWK